MKSVKRLSRYTSLLLIALLMLSALSPGITVLAEEKSNAAPSKLTYEDDSIKAELYATDGTALPTDAALIVKTLNKDSQEEAEKALYAETEAGLNAKAAEQGAAIDGFAVYSVSLIKDNEDITPEKGNFSLKLSYKETTAPEAYADSQSTQKTVAFYQKTESKDEQSNVVYTMEAQPEESTEIITDANGNVETVESELSNLQPVALTWQTSLEEEPEIANTDENLQEEEAIEDSQDQDTEKDEADENLGYSMRNYSTDIQAADVDLEKELIYSKTATVKDWDERTYTIDLKAQSKISQAGKADVMMVLDLSGSMNWTMEQNNVTNVSRAVGDNSAYSAIRNKLDQTKTYYYGSVQGKPNITSAFYYKRPMRCFNGTWKYYDDYRQFGTPSYQWVTIDDYDRTEIYTWSSRLTALKESASRFVSTIASESPDSKVGFSTFYGTQSYWGNTTTGTLNAPLKTIDENSLLESINKFQADGGTSPQLGLNLAKTELDKYKDDGNEKYVVLFSDGAPSEATDRSQSEQAANQLRTAGYTVITICVGDTNGKVPGSNLNTSQWLEQKIASDKLNDAGTKTGKWAYTALTEEKLNEIFDEIQKAIIKKSDLTAQITDTIDARFKLAAGEKERLTATGASVVENSDGTTTISWANQTIPHESKQQEWKNSIVVQAKEDYLGGNDVTTNTQAQSGIDTVFGDVSFTPPHVNVKASLGITDAEDTIFAGEKMITAEEIRKKLFDDNVINPKYGVNEEQFTFTWYSDKAMNQPIDPSVIKDTEPSEDTHYYLKVTYNAGAPSEESNSNTAGHIAGGGSHTVVAENTADASKNYADYTVHVVKGQLVITKTIDEQYTNVEKINSSQAFIFKIERYEVDRDNRKVGDTPAETFYETINFNANESRKSAHKTISGLKKGYYTVTEETNWSSKYDQTAVTDNYKDSPKDAKDLLIGELQSAGTAASLPKYYGLDNTEINGEPIYVDFATGDAAATEFKNTLKTRDKGWKWLSDTAIAVNLFDKSN
ncbi:vWA domain-containing protein [Eubacterium sp. 1001713B170207_170306_E7]|uniref:vWA domain-containing protein n=1 Tax=Eubacterium sp. 1001713B170207_170306_E7 TaxID=2787097 RepID=UPI001897524A|nr:vWA domain-containing protein [Eubacterium sp. 1001713B170207_170306_E7]